MSGATTPGQYDVELIRSKLNMIDLCTRDRIDLRRCGSYHEAPCPFHEERTPSFKIAAGTPDRARCYGCGWGGDIFDYWQASRGCVFKEAVEQIASLVGVSPALEGVRFGGGSVFRNKSKKASPGIGADGKREKPPLPPMAPLSEGDLSTLAELRGLSVEGVRVAAHAMRRVGSCDWPLWLGRDRNWRVADYAGRSWVVTDDTRNVAQFRMFDGQDYPRMKDGAQVGAIKCWTKGSPSWPIGAAEIAPRHNVLMVEGGADLLAAYHFLWGFDLLDRVAVVCMLGASNRIGDDALPFFAGKCVRIIQDADRAKPRPLPTSADEAQRAEWERIKAEVDAAPWDEDGQPVQPEGWTVPSFQACARWQKQLTEAGAAVESFSLYGLETATGDRVTDLNDLALCSAETLENPEITDAFFDWQF